MSGGGGLGGGGVLFPGFAFRVAGLTGVAFPPNAHLRQGTMVRTGSLSSAAVRSISLSVDNIVIVLATDCPLDRRPLDEVDGLALRGSWKVRYSFCIVKQTLIAEA